MASVVESKSYNSIFFRDIPAYAPKTTASRSLAVFQQPGFAAVCSYPHCPVQDCLLLIMCCFIMCNMWDSERGWGYIKQERFNISVISPSGCIYLIDTAVQSGAAPAAARPVIKPCFALTASSTLSKFSNYARCDSCLYLITIYN